MAAPSWRVTLAFGADDAVTVRPGRERVVEMDHAAQEAVAELLGLRVELVAGFGAAQIGQILAVLEGEILEICDADILRRGLP